MRDEQRDIRSAPTDVPFGLVVVSDGTTHRYGFGDLPDVSLRRQLRDAILAACMDRGGNVRSPGSVLAYVASVTAIFKAFATLPEQQLDAKQLTPAIVHSALFANLQSPIPVRMVLARKMLLHAASAADNDVLVGYLGNLTLWGYARASDPYTDTELEGILRWCKEQLSSMFNRRRDALASIGAEAGWDETAILEQARAVLAEPSHPDDYMGSPRGYSRWPSAPANSRWWTAQVYAHGFEQEPPSSTHQRRQFIAAADALFPTTTQCLAAQLLVINEYGAEGQMLASMDVNDVRRVEGNSSVMEIRGIKTRADKAVSRRGNAVTTWSGGKVLENWIEATAPARRWTGEDDLWQWRTTDTRRDAAKNLRAPIQHHIPSRPVILEGTKPITGTHGEPINLSIRKMRKTWAVRAERAIGAGVAGSLDPNHSRLTAWTFYRSAALSREERHVLISEAQDDLEAMLMASQIIVDTDLARPEAIGQLVAHGVDPATADRVIRGTADDSGTAHCKNAREAPGQAPGTLCRETPFACIICPNAIHTRVHLPVIIALRESIDSERATAPAEKFASQWNAIDQGVDRVLAGFSEGAMSEARKDLTAAQERLAVLAAVYS